MSVPAARFLRSRLVFALLALLLAASGEGGQAQARGGLRPVQVTIESPWPRVGGRLLLEVVVVNNDRRPTGGEVAAAIGHPASAVRRALDKPLQPGERRSVRFELPLPESGRLPLFVAAVPAGAKLATDWPSSGTVAVAPFDSGTTARWEEEMLSRINAERERHRLAPLALDPRLGEVARAHSDDMRARRYFSHQSPEGLSPFARMDRGGVHYQAAAENLAIAPGLARAHRGLLESPSHRPNLLSSVYRRIGIGIVLDDERGLIVTQLFAD